MPSRLTVVLVSLLLATPAGIFWLWSVILTARVAILCPEECRCNVDGFIVNCSASGIYTIPLLLLADVRGFLLGNNNITFLENDSFVSRELIELEVLQADFCQIKTVDVGTFNGITNLKHLSVRGNEISEIIPGTFEKMSSLEYLDLAHNKLKHLDVGVFTGLINLQTVFLARNKLHYLHPDSFVGSPNLQSLYLSQNSRLQIPNDSHFIYSHSLKSLGISDCNISSISVETLANVSALERLGLMYNNLRSLDINILKALPNMSTLYLHGNPLQCDCELQIVWRWCQDRNITTVYKETVPKCDTPRELKDVCWGVLEKGQCLEGNITYHRHYIHQSCNYTMEDMDTELHTLTDTVTESEQNGDVSAFLKHYEAPVYAVPFIFGTTGNAILIIIIICNKDMRTVPNMYILNLAISDLTYLTVHFFEAFAKKIFDTRLEGEFMCTFLSFCHRLSVGLTAYSVAVLSAYRYRITVNYFFLRVPSQSTGRFTVATVCGVWIVAALFAVPSALSKYLCYESFISGHTTYYLLVAIFELLVSCVIPLLVIAFSYIMTACHLVEMSGSMSEETQKRQVRALKKTAKVVLGLTLVFLISYVPYHAFRIYVISKADLKLSGITLKKINLHRDYKLGYTFIVLKCLLLLNSCLNPVALICMSFAFRRQFKRYLTCGCKANSPPNDLELTRRN
jgi:hypothetical protein